MNQKLNQVVYDPRSGTLFISLRPKTQRRPQASLEYPGHVVLDLDDEGDVYGVRLLAVPPGDAGKILHRLKAEPPPAGPGAGPGAGAPPGGLK